MTVAEFFNKAFSRGALKGSYCSVTKSMNLYLATDCDTIDHWLLEFGETEERVLEITHHGIKEQRCIMKIERFSVNVAIHRRKTQSYPELEKLMKEQSGKLLATVI